MLWFYESFFPVVWILFVLYWQIKATNTKATQRLEPAASRILRVFIFLIAIVLLSTTRIPLTWLYLQLWPVGLLPFWLGAAVTIAGLLFAVWAREHLGSNLGDPVVLHRIKTDTDNEKHDLQVRDFLLQVNRNFCPIGGQGSTTHSTSWKSRRTTFTALRTTASQSRQGHSWNRSCNCVRSLESRSFPKFNGVGSYGVAMRKDDLLPNLVSI